MSWTFVATLLGLGLANIALRATWHEVEDGVLWVTGPQGVTAAEVAAGTAAEQAGVRPGDVLLAIGEKPVQTPSEVLAYVHAQTAGTLRIPQGTVMSRLSRGRHQVACAMMTGR